MTGLESAVEPFRQNQTFEPKNVEAGAGQLSIQAELLLPKKQGVSRLLPEVLLNPIENLRA